MPLAVVMRTEPGVDWEARFVRVERRESIRVGLRRFWSSPVRVRIHKLSRFSRLHIFYYSLIHSSNPILLFNMKKYINYLINMWTQCLEQNHIDPCKKYQMIEFFQFSYIPIKQLAWTTCFIIFVFSTSLSKWIIIRLKQTIMLV